MGNPDFAIEREIRKRISPPRNPSSGWISIKKSKSGFHGFPFYCSMGKSEKRFAELFSWTVVFFLLSMGARARPLFLRTVFQIQNQISQNWNSFSDFAFDCKSQIRILKSKSRFPNRTHPQLTEPLKNFRVFKALVVAAEKILLNVPNHRFETWSLHMLDSRLKICVEYFTRR